MSRCIFPTESTSKNNTVEPLRVLPLHGQHRANAECALHVLAELVGLLRVLPYH